MKNKNLSLGDKIAYAVPAAPIAALSLPILVYLPPFYESLGLSLTLVGVIFMLNRLWDVVTDPALGVLSDHLPSRWGRRRHWLVISAPILMLSTYMLFLPPEGAGGVHLGVWLFILYIGYTLLSLSHMSWGTELTSDYHERSTIHGIREIAIIIGMITVIALPAVIEYSPWFENSGKTFELSDKVAAMGLYVIVLLPISLAIALWRVGEKPGITPPKIEWSEVYELLTKNDPLRRLLATDLLAGISIGTTGSLYLYFYSAYFNLADYSSILLLCFFISGCIAVPLWIKLSHRFGKHKAMSIACAYSLAVIPLVFLVPTGNLFWGLFTTITYGLASGAAPFLARSMMSDITDLHNLESGSQRTGLFFAVLSLTNKVGGALAVGTTYIILDLVNFVPYGDNSVSSIQAMSMLFVWVPVLCLIPATKIMWNYPLTVAQQEECRRLLALRDRDCTE